ncbi:MAG: hypothetical protein IIT98_06345 [Kiritimatiellae bacterium]|nr:hypothetical protein [Kiritimatiellia bacterium]
MNAKTKAMTAAAIALAAGAAWAVQGTVYTEKTSQTGEIKWQPSSKSYLILYKNGTTSVSAEYKVSEVTGIDVPKPASYDRLVELVKSGSGASAVEGLEALVKEYRMAVWDKPAGRYLVQAQLAAGNAQKALKTAEAIIADDPKAAWTGDLAPAYWQALLKLGKKSELERQLKKAAASGGRAASAEALIVRGDMILESEGDNAAAHRKALVEAYLRVALMYDDAACREPRRDAMLRCADSFAKIGMASRSEKMRLESERL